MIKLKLNKNNILNYFGGYSDIIIYQLISKSLATFIIWILRQAIGSLIWLGGRPAFTSGDIPFLLRSWQGWVALLIGFISLVIYTTFDLNATILMAQNILYQKKESFISIFKKAFAVFPRFFSFRGILMTIYASFLTPITWGALGFSVTSAFKMPDFMLEAVTRQPLTHALYILGLIVMNMFGVVYYFTFHYVVLGKKTVSKAMLASRNLMFEHWRDILLKYIKFFLGCLAFAGVFIGVFIILPLFIIKFSGLSGFPLHFCTIFITCFIITGIGLYFLLFLPLQLVKLTSIYDSYENPIEINSYPEVSSIKRYSIFTLFYIGACLGLSGYFAANFDYYFPISDDVEIIAHRGGGYLSTENTVESLDAAYKEGVYASEMDVQRTADNHYIINHDKNFYRLCGDPRRPSQMTLAEIKKLRINGTTEVATMEEMLDAAKGRLHLYIELKGETADHKMADDIYKMIKERDMVKDCSIISLNYGLIDYTETTYPELETIYLCYYSFGKLEELHCDGLGLEIETATSSNIDRIHAAGKRVDVWTCNTSSSISQFILSDVDGIITDEVHLANNIMSLMKKRGDMRRILNVILPEL